MSRPSARLIGIGNPFTPTSSSLSSRTPSQEYHNIPIGQFISAVYIRQTPTVFRSRTSYPCIGMIAHR